MTIPDEPNPAGAAPRLRRAQTGGAGRLRHGITATLIVCSVVGLQLAVWGRFNRPIHEIPWTGPVRGVSFSGYQKDQNPYRHTYPSQAQLDADLLRLQGRVAVVRTYSSTHGFEQVPRLARRHGLEVVAGAWLDRRGASNDEEIRSLVESARQNPNVTRVIVGNETILRGDLTVPRLASYLAAVRKRVRQPVSTAEPWHVWLEHPELARSVDFIAIHVLPYWEGVPAERAVATVFARYRQVQAAFPGKPVLIAEVGWPSEGNRIGAAVPSPVNQARFVRQFLHRAAAERVDYFVMEAFDQPWKGGEEGSVGPHWGLSTADRRAKFAMTGPIIPDPHWRAFALAASLLALGPMVWFVAARPDVRVAGRIFFAGLLQLCSTALALAARIPFAVRLAGVRLAMWGVLLSTEAMLLAVVLIIGFEMAEMRWQHRMKREFKPVRGRDGAGPKVSLHLAIHNEPPEVVFETLNSIRRLDYPDLEVLVVDNNTRDPAVWEPVRRHCERLGSRFRFFHLENWPGYKAGALNFALREAHPEAGIIAVVDSDYVLEPDWLKALVPHFDRDEVAFVQAPQDHRDWEGNAFKTMINWEYNGFFEIGMVQRNERNAIIQHGTMTLIRRTALERVGGWGEWCICEDAELGLRLLAAGKESVYVNHVFGRGVTPDTFVAYRNQRSRWVYGAVQILKGHWRKLVGGEGRLTIGQRFHFIGGWLPWAGDAVQLAFTIGGMIWSIGLLAAPRFVEFPWPAFLWLTLAVIVFKMVHAISLYAARVRCGWRERLGAALAGMALTHAIGKAFWTGMFSRRRPFLRTPKAESEQAWVQGLVMSREEALIAVALLTAAWGVVRCFGTRNAEAVLWSAVLAAQSLPYLAAVALAGASGLPARASQPVGEPAYSEAA